MSITRHCIAVDVTAAMPADRPTVEPMYVTATVVADPDALSERPVVVLAVTGGTYHRRYWDLQPPGRNGYSQAASLAACGVVFVACDYLGGGDSTRPDDGDFMTLEVAADASHAVYEQVRALAERGELTESLPALPDATYIGIGQSLGGLISIIQQGKYGDYPALGIFGSSPQIITNIPEHKEIAGLRDAPAPAPDPAAYTPAAPDLSELPMYHGAPREKFRSVFHVPDVPDDLWAYDEDACHTLISRAIAADAMVPGLAAPFADLIDVPVFLAFGEYDVSAHPRSEPAAYPRAPEVTVVVVPDMAHMHNFADTRGQLWRRFADWLTITAR
ncbi:alpha/beta hydrolase [Streptomyces sp. NPDC086082]|uniref:alpha/beta hydrolase n=1 Tax=Streptomyces sp. NPDC086082 TaxID=3365750 RepID=UPI003814FB93